MTDQELIYAVAVEVMGWEWSDKAKAFIVPDPDGSGWSQYIDWNPLTNANHRDMVVEHFTDQGYIVDLTYIPMTDRWECRLSEPPATQSGDWWLVANESAPTQGHAVCKAAWEAVGGE